MSNFTTRKTFLLPSLELDVKEREKMDKFLKLLEKSNVESLFPNRKIDDSFNGGRPPYSYHNLLAVVLYGFAFSVPLLSFSKSARYLQVMGVFYLFLFIILPLNVKYLNISK